MFNELYPVSASVDARGHLQLAGQDLLDLVEVWGTPLYLVDAATLHQQVSGLHSLLSLHYPGRAEITYAAKAYFSLGLARRLVGLDLGVDVVSLGELIIARRAGFPFRSIHLHGNNKTRHELELALEWNVQSIVVDSLDELEFLGTLAAEMERPARIWLRVTPEIEVDTHPYRQTGHVASKFGLSISDGQAAEAIRRATGSPWLELTGLHMHLGSQLFDPQPYCRGLEKLFALAAQENFYPREISPGGGWGVRYTGEDPDDDAGPWVEALSGTLQEQCRRLGWPLPGLILEPGRWIVARAGMALYTVGATKTAGDGTRIVALDGGMADNPRPALYQARYTACVVQRAEAPAAQKVTLVGRFCESGDVLIRDISLPELHRGDVLAVPVSGAYQLSMASNYNLAARPAALWVAADGLGVLQERELPEVSDWWGSLV